MNVASIAKRGLFLASLLGISASAAFAQSVATLPYGEDFEQWSTGAIYGNAPACWTVNEGDSSYVTNYSVATGNVLGLNTEGNELKLNLDTSATRPSSSANIYVDAKVKFVVSEDDPSNIPSDVKTAVFLNVNSNLVIYHGVFDDNVELFTTNTITSLTLSPDTFYQLTIETAADADAGIFFKYYIDGVAVTGPAGAAYSDSFADDVENGNVPGGNWFAAADPGNGNYLNSLAFQGTGFVDDISVSATSPLSSTWTLTVPALQNGSFQTNGVALAAGNYVFDTADAITVALVADTGYAAVGTTNGAAATFPVTFANMVADATITLAATITLKPVVVEDGNGTIIGGYDTYADALADVPAGYKLVDLGNGRYQLVACEYTWQVVNGATTNKYEDVADAIAAAVTGSVIQPLDDMTLDARIDVVAAGKTITIDLDGKTITRTGTSGNGSVFDVKSGTVTIQNGVIDCTQDDTDIAADGVYAITVRSGADVTLTDLDITVDSECGACAYPWAGGFLTITSGTYANVTTTPYRYHPAWTGMAVNQDNVAQKLINITGGSFSQVNPADGDDSTTGTADASATFVDPSYVPVLENGEYVVYEAVTVTFTSAHGTAPEAQKIKKGTAASEPAALSEEGWTFNGWTLNGAAYDFSAVVNADITLVADWTENVPVNPYPNSATAGGVTIISLADNGSNITFGTPVIAAGNVTVPFTGAIAGNGTVASGFYVQYTTAVNGAVSTVAASVTVSSATAGTATFAVPANTSAMFLVGLTDTAE